MFAVVVDEAEDALRRLASVYAAEERAQIVVRGGARSSAPPNIVRFPLREKMARWREERGGEWRPTEIVGELHLNEIVSFGEEQRATYLVTGFDRRRHESLSTSRLRNLILAAWSFGGGRAAAGSPAVSFATSSGGYDRAAGRDWAADDYLEPSDNRFGVRELGAFQRRVLAELAGNEVADLRARELLLRFLSATQRETFERAGYFVATGNKTGHAYSIREGRQINITCTTTTDRWCYVCPDVPLGDQLVAQKLLIEGDEERFLAVARRWPEMGTARAYSLEEIASLYGVPAHLMSAEVYNSEQASTLAMERAIAANYQATRQWVMTGDAAERIVDPA